jgi:hypothetical protein
MRRRLTPRLAGLALTAAIAAAPAAAWAWGASGHRLVGEAAMRALPPDLPAFLRSARAAADVGEYSREPDRLKHAGRAFDSDRDPGHFLDLGDDGSVLGGPRLSALPPTREDYEKALQAAGQDSWKAGYLPYSILENWQALAQDFAYWRVEAFAERNPAWAEHRAWFAADRARREVQIFSAIGELSHYVGDGSQPLHVSVHFNGWGDYPNPGGYSQAKLHAPFEGELVRQTVTLAAVEQAMGPPRPLQGPLEARIGAYLAATGAQVIPFYEMEKAGGMKPGDPRGTAFATRQLAIGAAELRDLVAAAWQASDRLTVGWRPVAVGDVLAGKADPYPSLAGVD